MATRDLSIDLDIAFFDELFPRAYPGVCDKTLEVARNMLSDGVVQIETLLELAISKVGKLKRRSVEGMDFVDGSDAKKSSVRKANFEQAYRAPVTKVHSKKGLLRVMVYERKLDTFYYFVFPREAYQHIKASSNIEIPFEMDGTPRRVPKRSGVISNWWAYEVDSFKKMSTLKKPKPLSMSELLSKAA
jgi:hypothetical protein